MLTPIGVGMVRSGVDVKGTGFFSMPNPHVWDRSNNEMQIITLGPGAEYEYNFQFRFFIAFNDIQIVDGEPVIGILRDLCGIVESIFLGIEAEAKRLKLVT